MKCEMCKKKLSQSFITNNRKTCSPECAAKRKKSAEGRGHTASADMRAAEFSRCNIANRFLLMPVRKQA